MSGRRVVLRILERFDRKPGDIEVIAERVLLDNPVDHRERRFIFELAYGVLRRRLTLDYVLGQYVQEKRLLESNLDLKRVLELGAYQILFLDKVPEHAAVNESVELAKRAARTRPFAGLVNAVLRRVIADRRRLPMPDAQQDLEGRLAVEHSHPRWLVARWLRQFGLARAKRLLAYNNEPAPVYLRRRVHGLGRVVFETEARPIAEPAAGMLNLYYRLTAPLPADGIALVQNGSCTVQAPSAGWVVALMDVKPGDQCLDLCSAPGGKAMLIAELAGPQGDVFAADLKTWRLMRLVENCRRMGVANVHPFVTDVQRPGVGAAFAKVLLDAPCSGTGVMHRHPEARWTRSEADIDAAAALQRSLLASAATLVSGGGLLVYATCSLEPQENEDVVAWFLREHPAFSLEPPPAIVPGQFVGLDKCLHIVPADHAMDGAFAARLRRVAS